MLRLEIFLATFVVLFLLSAHLILLSGCPTPVCPTLAMRCNGTRVETCDSRGQWSLVADCTQIAEQSGGEWTCQATRDEARELHACLPVENP